MKEELQDLDLDIIKVDRGDQWLTSYSDLVTVLLCFFILFFIMKAKMTEKITQEALTKRSADKVLVAIGESMESSTSDKKLDLRRLHQYIQVVIKHQKLFEGEELTIDARYQLAKLAEAAFKYTPEIMLQIKVGVKGRNPASEGVSIMRSLKVRNYLAGLGLAKELMSIGSYQITATEEEPQEEVHILISRNISKTDEL